MMPLSLRFTFIFLVCVFLTLGCEMTSNTFQVTVKKPVILDQVPSGSGMVALEGATFIISDDSPSLFQLNKGFEILSRTELTRGYADVLRIEKPVKPDYECLALFEQNGSPMLYGFGSGSLAEKRDSLAIIDPKQERIETHNLTQFYNRLELLSQGKNREKLNIEGAVIYQETLFLLNRGTNAIFSANINAFNRCLKGEDDFDELEIDHFRIKLPAQDGVFVGLSGCSLLPGTTKLLFTATAEATSNWIDDGEILGSYLGLLDIDQLREQQQPALRQFELNGRPLKDKIESITILSSDEGSRFTALAIADNDDGTSKIFPLELRIHSKPGR